MSYPALGIIAILLASVSTSVYPASALNIVINELELNPQGNDGHQDVMEWIELYNPSGRPIDLSGWTISSTAGVSTSTLSIEEGATILARGHLLIESSSQWLDNSKEVVVLRDPNGNIVDQAGPFSDDNNDASSWQRYPDGSGDWFYKLGTPEARNSQQVKETVPVEVVTVSNMLLVDQVGSPFLHPDVGQAVLVQSDLKNILQKQQAFAYIVQIKDSDGFTVMISWLTGALLSGQAFTAAQSWIPEKEGSYAVEVFVWQSVNSPTPLSFQHSRSEIRVGSQQSSV